MSTAVLAGRRRPVVLANGAEGEPPARKDRMLLAYAPHLVLDGAILAARVVEARDVIVAVQPAVRVQFTRAVEDRRTVRKDAGISLRVVVVPERFVAGEETALVQFVNGRPGLPTFTPPRLSNVGSEERRRSSRTLRRSRTSP